MGKENFELRKLNYLIINQNILLELSYSFINKPIYINSLNICEKFIQKCHNFAII